MDQNLFPKEAQRCEELRSLILQWQRQILYLPTEPNDVKRMFYALERVDIALYNAQLTFAKCLGAEESFSPIKPKMDIFDMEVDEASMTEVVFDEIPSVDLNIFDEESIDTQV